MACAFQKKLRADRTFWLIRLCVVPGPASRGSNLVLTQSYIILSTAEKPPIIPTRCSNKGGISRNIQRCKALGPILSSITYCAVGFFAGTMFWARPELFGSLVRNGSPMKMIISRAGQGQRLSTKLSTLVFVLAFGPEQRSIRKDREPALTHQLNIREDRGWLRIHSGEVL